jgi:hypothetical protein
MTNAAIATAIVEAINNAKTDPVLGYHNAHDAIAGTKRDALRAAFVKAGLGTSKAAKAMKVADLRAALTAAFDAAVAAKQPAPKPEKKQRKPRGSKYTALLTQLMDEHADENGVAVVTASTLLAMGFAKSTTVYHADWHKSLPCGKAAGELGLVGRLSTKGDGENTVTIRRIA